VRGLLDFAAPREIELQPADVDDVVERTLRLVKGDLLHARVAVTRRSDGGLPLVSLDVQKIQQVFVNLITNACQAIGQGGVLVIETREGRGGDGQPGVVVLIDDTGPGIPEDQLDRIFDPFFTTKAPGEGTGLGLSVCKTIVELHGGTIIFTNRPEGGVRVTLTFPLVPQETTTWSRSEYLSSTTR